MGRKKRRGNGRPRFEGQKTTETGDDNMDGMVRRSDNRRQHGGIKKRFGQRNRAGPIPSALTLDDGDDNMGLSITNASRGARSTGRRGRGRGSVSQSAQMMVRRMGGTATSSRSWHKVIVTGGSRYEKEELLNKVIVACKVPLAPICYSKSRGSNNAEFFVETVEMANAIKILHQNLTLSDGMKLSLKVISCPPPPNNPISDELKEKIKTAMGSPDRYKPDLKALDLREFHRDKAFLGEQIYATPSRSSVMKILIGIVRNHIPQVQAIDLSGNRIANLDDLKYLSIAAPDVKTLYLTNNNIRKVEDLQKCQLWKLEELKLSGNPCSSQSTNASPLQTSVQKVFPSLKILDDVVLQRLVTFEEDDTDSKPLPPTIKLMSVEVPGLEQLVLEFVKKYYQCYDMDSRQPLLDAYHEHAMMSMSAFSSSGKGFSAYIGSSRNLKVLSEEGDIRRQKCLHRGKLSIVSFLDSLPKTEHDPNSFTLDVTLATEATIVFSITGLFRERNDPARVKPIRSFSRYFVLTKVGDGWNIINDMLYLSFPTKSQLNDAFSQTSDQPSLAPQIPDASTKQSMMVQLAQNTNMNERYTQMCLEESGWNFSQALSAFETANREGKIPMEAFERIT